METTDLHIELRNLSLEDFPQLNEVMSKAYKSMGGDSWPKYSIDTLMEKFPEGQLCVEINGKLAACALSIIVDYKKFGHNHTYNQITGNYTFSTHDGDGDVLYGIDVFVDPEYHNMRLGRRLYDARKELCENLNLRAIIIGGRIPGYEEYYDQYSPKQYIEAVMRREIYDPILTFQISNDFRVIKVLKNYLNYDKQSRSFATLLEWPNIYYEEEETLINKEKNVVRIGLVQWQMRPMRDMEALVEQIEFFIDATTGYRSDFVVFPELFNAPLMAKYNNMPESEAIRKLSDFTEPLKRKFQEFAITYNTNIITGSMPLVENQLLYNTTYLCHRDGSIDEYRKIHITPNEKQSWGMSGGYEVKSFETDCGKIGILICYDVEFPELSRIYGLEGVQILFVPFMTDTQNGFNRVRRCAAARAVENECYVAMAGSVGNLPRVSNMDIQYAQSVIFSPSDFAFPAEAIVAEATPNTEMTIIADVDLNLIKELRIKGSVHTIADRRTDIYQLNWKKPRKSKPTN